MAAMEQLQPKYILKEMMFSYETCCHGDHNYAVLEIFVVT